MPALFSSPSDNAAQAAAATSTASDAQIDKEIGYVNKSEDNLRGAIAGLGPNPYFTPPTKPAPLDPNNKANFFTPGPPGTSAAAPAPQPSQNLFAAPQQRQAQPVMRAPAQAAQ